jgi:citrate synthase
MMAKMPTLVASCYRHGRGETLPQPGIAPGYVENFLELMFGGDGAGRHFGPAAVRALELIMILHADHEQNASTSTVRLAGSSGANPFAVIAAGIASLWGPAHGGANEAVIRMLQSIRSVDDVPALVERAKDKEDPFRLVGFGHRVYKNYDPRARIIRAACHDLVEELHVHDDPLFRIACELERIALEDDYFKERRLYPNVDFYSGVILKAIGIPLNMFTAIFALSRTAGWVAQWLEMMDDPELRIGRPRQLYVGYPRREYVAMDGRRGR